MTLIATVFKAIAAERTYQDIKYDPIHRSLGDWILIMEAELNEAKHAFIKKGREETLREILQVAAVAVASLQDHGVVEREELAEEVDDASV